MSLRKKCLPFECFTNDRTEFRHLKASDHLNTIFAEFCSKYENRILIYKNVNSPSLITYSEALKNFNDSHNEVIKAIRNDITGKENRKIEKKLKVRNDNWPLIVHVKKIIIVIKFDLVLDI